MPTAAERLPLEGICVIERSRGVAAAYAGRLLAALGAETIMFEDLEGSPLRQEPPLLQSAGGLSALFAYLAAGKRSLACDLSTEQGQATLERELHRADILIDDTPLAARHAAGLDAAALATRHPQLIHASVLPFGAFGDKADWKGEEINMIHAGGEGYLLPNGLTNEMFPDRPPLKIYGHFAEYQGGVAAALSALAALWARPSIGGQVVDTAVQDAVAAVGAFAIQRLGDGSLEHRTMRRFRYGGVFEGADGYIEFLMLEDRQWQAFVELLGRPAWATESWLDDPLERSRRGDEINVQIRQWARGQCVDAMVERAQALGVPAAKYRGPDEILRGEHELARQLFTPVSLPGGTKAQVLVAPFQFRETPLRITRGVPELGEYGQSPELWETSLETEEAAWAR
jgi:crotonobetainyl-CoA:carnitine CoA-transferase CaiB-like acyl-CoA transferase